MAGFGEMMKAAQKMKAEMERIQSEAATKTVEGSAGGGMVTAVANGKGELLSVKIDPEVAREDLEMLQDLVAAAANDALRKARELMTREVSQLAGGLNLWTGPINLQDKTPYLTAGTAATDTQIWYLPQLLDGMQGQSVSK